MQPSKKAKGKIYVYAKIKKGGTLWAKCTVNTEYETPKITSETRGFDTIVIYALFQLEAFIFPARTSSFS